MPVLTDPSGVQWSIHRELWPFPVDASDLTFDVFEIVTAGLCALLWPLWFIGKFVGVPWVIVIERQGNRVGAERIRGWGKSATRMTDIARDVAAGYRTGPFVI